MSDESRLALLWAKLNFGGITEEEKAEFERLLQDSPDAREFIERHSESDEIQKHLAFVLGRNDERILAKIDIYRSGSHGSSRKLIYAIAAAVIGLVMFGAILYFNPKDHGQSLITSHSTRQTKLIVPGHNQAILQLSNGSTIVLDKAQNGVLAEEGNSEAKLKNGRLIYEPQGHADHIAYETVSTPRGGQFPIRLPDGTQVWLDAASSIRFPTNFMGGDRVVEVTGQCDMVVAKNKTQPFKVKLGDHEVVVLGTHFNISAYEGETFTATLLEGSVKVEKGNQAMILRPGEQALGNDVLRKIDGVDLDEVTAWKNGMFQFHGASIQTVMNSLARWYDVEIHYEGQIPSNGLNASIRRDNLISDVLQILEASGYHFKIEGKTITVLP